MNKKYYKISFIFFLIIINILLIHKYNIFNGDDGILIPHIADYHFFHLKDSIICKEWPIHKFYLILLSDLYLNYYELGAKLLTLIDVEFINIKFFTLVLFFFCFIIFYQSKQDSTNLFWYACIFLTLEPFLVMSHSIRHDIFIFFGLSILLYILFNFEKHKNYSFFILPIIWLLLLTHPSGYPFIIISVIYLFIFNKNKYYISLPLGLLAIFIHIWINDITFIQIIELFKNRYTEQEKYLIGSENAFTIEKIIDYFWYAKYKRHLLEILIFIPYLHLAFYFKKLSKKEKFFYLIPLVTLAMYQMLNYFNVSYFKHLYLIFLSIYIKLNYDYFIKIKFNNSFKISLVKISSILFIIVYFCIAFIFLPHDSWGHLIKNKSKIDSYIENKNLLVAAPLYYGFLFPKKSSKYLPIRQLGDKRCKESIDFKNQIDILMIDTKSLNESQNDNPQFKYLNFYLKKMKMVEKIRIGRLATQSLNKDGFLYIYKKK